MRDEYKSFKGTIEKNAIANGWNATTTTKPRTILPLPHHINKKSAFYI